ncbi:MAG: transporter-like [Xanthobacteraceae bacterium]|jgi:simple sugar transport system ATP-binding protein|nr:transporter-like [Xanthobacteraceae bacterium]
MDPDALLRLTGVSKSFVPGHPVLENVSMSFRRGELHAVLGENGAGKSTMLNIVFGLHQPDEGGLLLDGRQVIHRSPSDAIANGIGMVHQHFKLVPSFTAGENLRLAATPAARRRLSRDADIGRLAESFGLPIPIDIPVAQLPLALQQRVEIVKALVNEAALILFDEPTTILGPEEIAGFYAVLRRLAADGRGIVVVTHHLAEVLDHADRVTVIRHGRLVSSGPVAGRSRADLVRDIVGRSLELEPLAAGQGRADGDVVARLEKVSLAPRPSSAGLRDVSLELRRGEVVGVAGVEGNGQRELFDVVAGLVSPERGTVTWMSGAADPSAPERVAAPGLVPEDRHREGLVLDLPVSLNLLLDRIGEPAFSTPAGRLRHADIASHARSMCAEADVRTHSVEQTPRTLSGGNQQKIVLARALAGDSLMVVVHQPTRGLDFAASEEVLRRLRAAAGEGRAVLVISSHLDELLRISDRIVVIYGGRIVGQLSAPVDRERLGVLMTGDEREAVPA